VEHLQRNDGTRRVCAGGRDLQDWARAMAAGRRPEQIGGMITKFKATS
jgi:hypothetical protein